MDLPSLIHIGYTKRTFGYQGEVTVFIKEEFIDFLDDSRCVFLEIDGFKIPFFLEHIDEKSDIVLKFDDIHSSEEAQKILGKQIFIEETLLSDVDLESIYIKGNIEGFMVINEGNEIGIIAKIEELPSQLLAHVKQGEKTYLIPIVEDFIQSIDVKSKIVYLTLPEGLLSL